MVRLKNKTFVVVIKGPYRAVARGPFNDEKPQQGDHDSSFCLVIEHLMKKIASLLLLKTKIQVLTHSMSKVQFLSRK